MGVLEVIVDPAVRRKGVGHELLGTLVQRAYAEGFTSLGVEVIDDTPSVKFYEHYGFRRTDEGPHDLFGTPLFTMVKPLL